VRGIPSLVTQLRPDLLFLDWQLTGFDSNATRQRILATLRVQDPALYIIALTNDDGMQSCLRLGAYAFINRAESPDHILATVHQAANRSSILRRDATLPERLQ
jgi:CheY-like chemotaxis protein